MNIFVKILFVIALLTSITADTAVSKSDNSTAVFNFGGTINEICKIKSVGTLGASSLVIDSSNIAQSVGTLEVWCNNGRNPSTNYVSSNNGYLVSGNNQIPYTLAVGSISNELDLSTAQKINATEAGSGKTGTGKIYELKIKPTTTGLDLAGDYSDTITVTVGYK